MLHNKENAEDLFGPTKERLKATGNHVAEKGDLKKPFASEYTVARIFCKGCGMIGEGDQEVVNRFMQKAELNERSFKNKYIEVGGCVGCDGNVDDISVKEI